ncbi:MAG: M28 family metallopeptidase [Candidatus Sericytochromatia bacterium]
MKKVQLVTLLGAAALTLLSCNALINHTQSPQPSLALRSFSQNRTNPQAGIEKLVDPTRMEANLAALTGKNPIAPNSSIPERGTVQGRALTRQYISQTLEGLGYKVEPHEYRRNGINITARLMADEPTEEYIVVGAHMDSVRNAGADDNASGSTAVLEAAAVLPQLKGRKVNILFAWFDEEELGLIGSGYLARSLKKQGIKITSVHTSDMLGWDADGDKTVEVARPDGILWDYYQMVNKTHGLNLPLDRTSTGQSDHVSFHDQGYASVCLSEEWTSNDSTPYYHQRGDQFATINRDFLAAGTQLMIAAVGDLSLKVPPPANIQVIPHERFPSRPRQFHASYEEALH